MNRRLDVCGVGVTGGFGHGWHALNRAVASDESMARNVDIEHAGRVISYPAYLPDLDTLASQLGVNGLRRIDRFSRMAVLAGAMALEDAKPMNTPRERIGVIIATGYGTHESMFMFYDSCHKYGESGASPLLYSNSGHSSVLAHVTIQLKLEGPGSVICQPGAAFTMAMVSATHWLHAHRVDAVLLIALDECHPILRSAWHQSFGDAGRGPISPFALDHHSGMLAEGAAAYVLTRSGSAERSRYGSIDHSQWLKSGAAPAIGPGELAVIGADGMLCTSRHYREMAETLACAAFSPAFGSMPIGMGLNMGAALGLWRDGASNLHPRYWHPRLRKSPPTWPQVVHLIECTGEGDMGHVVLSRN
jgi:hypothetical protein